MHLICEVPDGVFEIITIALMMDLWKFITSSSLNIAGSTGEVPALPHKECNVGSNPTPATTIKKWETEVQGLAIHMAP